MTEDSPSLWIRKAQSGKARARGKIIAERKRAGKRRARARAAPGVIT